MSKHVVKFGHIELTIADVIVIKTALSVALIAAFFVPPPWHIPVGIAANMVWVWRL